MNDIDSSFKEQQRLEDAVSLRAMIIQVCINLGFAIFVLFLFSWLRPRHDIIYAPKAKLSKADIRRPYPLGPGWFDWIKPVFKIKDNSLLENIGFDAYTFIYFTRILRRLIIVLTLISMFIFLPVTIVATYTTGDWPPVGLEFLSISAMNYQYGKQSKAPNNRWYWAPTIATWVFSIIIIYQMIYSSKKFILFREKYYIRREETTKLKLPSMSPIEFLQQQKQDLLSRTLLVHFHNNSTKAQPRQQKSPPKQYIIPNENIKQLVESTSALPCQQVLVGKYNNKVASQIKGYNRIIKALEEALNNYLYRINHQQNLNQKKGIIDGGSTATIKRPQIRLNWRSKNIDAINYYTERALVLDASIKRNRLKLQDNNYGWVIYPSKSTAHEAYLAIEKSLIAIKSTDFKSRNPADEAEKDQMYCERVRLAPHPDDIVWPNMNVEKRTGQLKRWFGYGLYYSIVFAWAIPIAMLAITSNMINLVRLFPKSAQIINDNQLLMGVIQSYLTPCLMVLFYIGLPDLLRYISRQQSYKTETVLQQKILSKLYAFFVINNLFIFTLVSIMLGIMGQITALTLVGTLRSKSMSQYIVQIAKNMTDVSSFWINYVCIRSVSVIVDLLQVAPLLGIIVFRGKVYFRYTPRQLEKVAGAPPFFDFAKNYGLIISFFTAALVYSVTAPIVLPFALIYFGLATTTYKYKLMYINVTKVETHGKIWPMLYCIVMISLFVFQVMMILILSLKTGVSQIYTLLPLPFITAIILIVYTRRLLKHNTLKTWIELKNTIQRSNIAPISNSKRNSNSSDGSKSKSIELNEIASTYSSKEEEEDPMIRDACFIDSIYEDPTLHDPLWKPMLFDELKNLLPDVYRDHPQRDRILNTLYSDEEDQQVITSPKPVNSPPVISEEDTVEEIAPSPIARPIDEKLQVKEEMAMYPPTPLHSPLHASSYYHYYQEQEDEGGSSHAPIQFTAFEPVIEDMATAPPLDLFHLQPQQQQEEEEITHHIVIQQQLQPPPPNYADAVISPRINRLHQLGSQQKQPPVLRRHSIS